MSKAARHYRAVLQHSQSRYAPDALLGLAQLAAVAGKPQEAGTLLDQLLKRFPDSPLVPSARLQRGRAWFEQGRFEDALAAFAQVPSNRSDLQDDVSFWTAKCRIRMGDFSDAAERLGKAIEQSADSELLSEMQYDYAFALARAGRLENAVNALERFRAEFPDHPMAPDSLHMLAATRHSQGRYEQSQVHCRGFLKQYPSHELAPATLFLSAENEFLSGRYAEAVELYQRYLAHQPDDTQATRASFRLGMALYRLQRFDEAQPLLAGVAHGAGSEIAESYRSALSALGNIHFQSGKWKQAAEYFDRYLASGHGAPEPPLAKGEEQPPRSPSYLAGAGEGGLATRDQRLDLPAADDALLKLGLALQRQGRHEDALRTYDRLLERFAQSPHRLQARFERGQSLHALGRSTEAADAFRQVLSEGSDSRFTAYAEDHLGSIALTDKRYKDAAEHFERSSDASARHSSAPGLGLGDQPSRSPLGEGEQPPLPPLGKAEMEGSGAVLRRGLALMGYQRYGDAEKAFKRFLELDPSNPAAPEARARQAMALSRQDRFSDALQLIERVEREWGVRSPSAQREGGGPQRLLRDGLLYEKAWCLNKLDRPDQAATVYRTLLDGTIEQGLRLHVLLELAAIEAAAKRYDAAVPLLRQLREAAGRTRALDPAEVPARLHEQGTYRLAVCLFETKAFSEAASIFEDFIGSFPDSSLLPSASLLCGEALIKLGKHGRAVTHLTRVVENFASDVACAPSMLRLGDSLAVLQRWSKSEAVLADFLSAFPDSAQGYQARFGIGWARENQGRYGEAIKAYLEVVSHHQGPTAARAQFQIGECLFAQQQYHQAVGELLKVDILYAYPQWSAAAVFEAGRCFEKLNNPAKARSQFQTVVEKFGETRWARMAQESLSQLSVSNALPGR